MSRGRRYNKEKKLNLKKVFAVLIAIIVIIMVAIGIRKLLSQDKTEKITNESYYSAYENNKYGIINSKGETIIEPAYAELIIVPNQNKDVFLCTYDVNYESNTYKTKALNRKNEEIFTNYDNVEPLENHNKNNVIKYNSSTLKVQKDGKYGLINIEGKEILPCEYDKIYEINDLENSIVVEKEGKVGLVDNNGKIVIDIKYKQIKKLTDDYKNGYIVVDENEKYGTVDCANNIVLENKYDEIKPVYDNGLYVVKATEGYNIVDKKGNIITKKEYQNIVKIQNNKIVVQENKKYGVISNTGEQIIPCNYEEIDFAFTDSYIVKKEGKYGIVNSKNEFILEAKYQFIQYIKEADFVEASEDGINSNIINNKFETNLTGIVSEINTEKGYLKLRINDEYKYYNFKFEEKDVKDILTNNELFLSKKDGKYGFINKQGEVIVDYIYDDATEQNSLGYAAINKDGKWGSIDKTGNIIANVENDLSQNPIIDFIGTWHLMKDANINCYTR